LKAPAGALTFRSERHWEPAQDSGVDASASV